MRRDRGVAPKSAWTMFCAEQEQQRQQSSLSSSTRLPLHLASHPSFPLHVGVNALAGPAGSGKTQICLSLIADCVLHQQQPPPPQQPQPTNRKAVFISLGKDTTVHISQRLHSMLKHRKLKTPAKNCSSNNNSNIDEFIKQEYLSKVFVNWVRNPEDLFHMLYYTLPKLIKEHDSSISLVVLDGIATLFRGNQQEHNGRSGGGGGKSTSSAAAATNWVDRSAKFFQIASQCQRLSFDHQVPFLFTNEATSKLSLNSSTNGMNLGSSSSPSSELEPALGLSWAQCINSSYFVQRSNGNNSNRVLKCIQSPHMATNGILAEFAIEQRGTERIK